MIRAGETAMPLRFPLVCQRSQGLLSAKAASEREGEERFTPGASGLRGGPPGPPRQPPAPVQRRVRQPASSRPSAEQPGKAYVCNEEGSFRLASIRLPSSASRTTPASWRREAFRDQPRRAPRLIPPKPRASRWRLRPSQTRTTTSAARARRRTTGTARWREADKDRWSGKISCAIPLGACTPWARAARAGPAASPFPSALQPDFPPFAQSPRRPT